MLWFDTQAEEAANFYVSLFKDGKITGVSRGPDGKAFVVNFEIAGSRYLALNGGPLYTFNEAFSIFVNVEDQAEVDRFWDALTAGGEESRCGWLKDKYGLSWQIVPKALGECLGHPDPEKAGRAMQAMMGMKKIIVAELVAAVV
jgi:predicted 3-demethylubiquinone-9 3-methyltransferase (glyoxalase superfamily)